MSDNPYASPVENWTGEYDHSLFWRLLKISAAFFVFFAAVDCWAWYRYHDGAKGRNEPLVVLTSFFTDWSAGKTPPRSE